MEWDHSPPWPFSTQLLKESEEIQMRRDLYNVPLILKGFIAPWLAPQRLVKRTSSNLTTGQSIRIATICFETIRSRYYVLSNIFYDLFFNLTTIISGITIFPILYMTNGRVSKMLSTLLKFTQLVSERHGVWIQTHFRSNPVLIHQVFQF